MNIRVLFLSVLAVMAAMACGQKEDPVQPIVKLVAQPSELSFDATGGTQTLVVTSGTKPDISCSDKWITLSEGAFSSNSLTLQVKAEPFDGTTARSTSIRIIGDKQSLMVPVKQDIPQVKLSADKTSVSFDRFGGEVLVTVTSSQQPSVTSDASWCGAVAGSIDGKHQTSVSILAGANRTQDTRKATVTISCGNEKVTVSVSGEAGQTPAVASTTALTPQLIYDTMAPGWNMGNHMDAISNGVSAETIWGNQKCTQATFDGVKAAGFKSVRICVTWQGHIGEAPGYRLEEKWLGRVEEIVGYAEKAGLVAIVNTHHDESYWLDIAKAWNNATQNEKVKDEIFTFWTQVANRFKDKGEWLIFESLNEIQDGGWGWSDAFKANPDAQYKVLNEWNQVFVDAVRATGGNNATRWLGVPGYAASPTFTIPGFVLPRDYTSANRLMVAVHDYDPYEYTIKDPMLPRFGHTAAADKRPSGDNEAGLRWTFDQLKEAYTDKGLPVYLGEFGCSRHNPEDIPYQKYYMEYFCKAAADHLFPMLLWDNGGEVKPGPEHHLYIDHGTGKVIDDTAQQLLDVIMKAATTKDAAYTLESVYNSAPKN